MIEIKVLEKWFPFIKIIYLSNVNAINIWINEKRDDWYITYTGNFWWISFYRQEKYSLMQLIDVLIESLIYQKIY